MAASRLFKVSRVMVLICFSWLGHSCAQLSPYAANGGAFHATDRPSGMDGHPKGPDCQERQSSACIGGEDSVLKGIGRSVVRLEEIHQENKVTMFQLVASVNAVRQSLERGMPCTSITTCSGETTKDFNGQVKVLGFDDQISRIVGAIDSLKNRQIECCNSDVESLRSEQKKLSDAVQELRKRIEALEKMNEDGGVGEHRDVIKLLLGVGALFGVGLGWVVNNIMHTEFPETRNPYASHARELKKCSKEISEGYRHYSNLRFAVFTLFVAVSGALGALNFGKDYQGMIGPLHPVLPMVGIVLTIAFCAMEFVIDLNQTEYFYMAKAVWNLSPRPPGISSHKAIALGARIAPVSNWNRRVRYFIWLIFGTVLFVWVSVWNFSG